MSHAVEYSNGNRARRRMAARIAALLFLFVPGCGLFGIGDDDKGDVRPDGGLGQTCAMLAECADDLVCAAGVCIEPGTVGLGGPCSATRDCGEEFYCNESGLCAPAGDGQQGESCLTGAQCERGLVCRLFGFGGTCEDVGGGDLGDGCTAGLDCIAGLVCAADQTCKGITDAYPPFAGVECAEPEGAFRGYFEVPRGAQPLAEFFRIPFPTDIRVDSSGNLDMAGFPFPDPGLLGVDLVKLYTETLVEDFDGFSSTAVVTLRFSEPINFDTATSDSIKYVNLDTGNAVGYGWSYTSARTGFNCKNRLTVRNSTRDPLNSGETYAVYVTTDVQSDGGTAAAADADLVAVLGASRPSDPDLGHAWDVHQPFRNFLSDNSIAPATIASVAVFTVQNTTARMAALAVAAAGEPAPTLQDLTLCGNGVTSPCDDGGSRVCGADSADFFEIHGRLRIPIYQVGVPPYEFPEAGGAINVDGAGSPAKVSDSMVCFALTVPRKTAPVGGFPLVVYGHGTGGSFTGITQNGVAGTLATASTPTAVLSWDGVVHGERKNGSTRDSDSLMFNVVNPRASRDNNLQGAVDVLQVLRVPEVGTISVAGVADFSLDAARTYYFGHSQGSNVGTLALASSDASSAAVLSGAGAFLTASLMSKSSPVDAQEGLRLLLNEPSLDGAHPVMTIWQTFFDSSDMVNYAPQLIRRPLAGLASKHVFMSYGPGDTYSPPVTLKHMAQASGLHQVGPVIDDLALTDLAGTVGLNLTGGDGAARFGAVFQYQPDGYDGHFVATRDSGAIADWSAFLSSLIETGTPAVP